jgi:hypothetical protein
MQRKHKLGGRRDGESVGADFPSVVRYSVR